MAADPPPFDRNRAIELLNEDITNIVKQLMDLTSKLDRRMPSSNLAMMLLLTLEQTVVMSFTMAFAPAYWLMADMELGGKIQAKLIELHNDPAVLKFLQEQSDAAKRKMN